MSDGNMTYEDWLRGCVHHDGRHGYVTLPCDEVLKIADFIERLRADRKTENSSEKPNNCKTHAEGVWNAGFKTGYDKGYKDAQKVKDSQDLVKDLVKAFCEDGTWLERQGVYTLTLAEAKQRAADIIESVTQTETQNSNLTFEKRTMLDCYNCKRFDTEDECIECHYEPKDEPQTDVYEYHNGEWVKPDCQWK